MNTKEITKEMIEGCMPASSLSVYDDGCGCFRIAGANESTDYMVYTLELVSLLQAMFETHGVKAKLITHDGFTYCTFYNAKEV